MFLRIVLPLYFLCGSFFLYGQSPWTIYNDQNSPLPQNTVRCLAVDSQNNIWAGTDYGLAKFTGTAWIVYNTFNSPLPDNNIRALATDTLGAVWVGTLSAGVARFYNNAWTIYNTSNSGLPGNFIRTIAFDHSGNVWFGGSAGLSKFDGTLWTSWNNINSPLISHHISSIAIGEDNTIFIGTINGGMVYKRDTSYTFYNLWNGLLPDNTILSVALDTSGNRWVAMPSGGLAADYGSSVWQGFTTMNSAIQTDALNSVYVDKRNTPYIGSQDKGLIIRRGLDFINYDSLNSDLPDVNVLSLIKDESGTLWLGTMYGGLVKFDETQTAIQEFKISKCRVFPSIVIDEEEIFVEINRSSPSEIIDIHGRVLYRFDLKAGKNAVTMQLTNGIYFVRIIASGEVARFVKI